MRQNIDAPSGWVAQNKNVRWGKNFKLIALLVGLVILPPALAPPVRFEDILMVVMLVSLALTNKKIFLPRKVIALSLVMAIAFIVSLISGLIITDVPVIGVDFTYLGLILKYFILFLLITNFTMSGNGDVYNFLVIISWVGSVSAVVAISQYLNIGGINSWLTPIYISQEFYLDVLVNEGLFRRSIGTSFNANHFSFLLVFPLISTLLLALIYRKYKYLILNFIVFSGIITTLSRTGIFNALIVVSLVYLTWKYKRKRGFIVAIFILAVIAVGGGYILFNSTGTVGDVLARVSREQYDVLGENSIGERIRRWFDVLYWLGQYPQAWLFGVGPQKSVMYSVPIDSQYFGSLKKTGVIGLMLILLLEIGALVTSFKSFVHSKETDLDCISLYTMAVITSLLVAQLTIEIVNDTQVMALVIITIGVFISNKRKYKERS